MNEGSIRKLSPDFTIPAGTQVVLTEHLRDQANRPLRKAGTVGIVVKCPPDNSNPYVVRFADESEAEIPFDQLTMRRREIENILNAPADHESYRQHIIYRCQVGSFAFGLNDENSDTDVRGIFLPPANLHWSLFSVPEQIEFQDGEKDEVFWELEKFLKLALKANPNILETLWTPIVLESSPVGDRLRTDRRAFLSNHIYKTYSGYVLSQFRRMKNAFETKGTYKPKHAMHLIRLLHSGIGALKTGEIMIDVSDHRDLLLEIKSGAYSFDQVEKLALELDREFQAAFESTSLPDQPDFETVNSILIDARTMAANNND